MSHLLRVGPVIVLFAVAALYGLSIAIESRNVGEDAEERISRYPGWMRQLALLYGRPTSPLNLALLRLVGALTFLFSATMVYVLLTLK
jgi:hypothetical protein